MSRQGASVDTQYRSAQVIGRFCCNTPHAFCDYCRKHEFPSKGRGSAGYVVKMRDGAESLIGGTCARKHCGLTYAGRLVPVNPNTAKWVPLIPCEPRSGDPPRR